MLQRITQLYDDTIGALDGDVGHVEDMYFDDRSWAVRYLVTDTGSWLAGRKVLISPHAFRGLDHHGKRMVVQLTRKQIEECPPVEDHKPVSRQYEERYHLHYGFPFYWEGDGLWGMSGYPVSSLPAQDLAERIPAASPDLTAADDPHLRSTQAVNGYQIMASDGTIGHVCDFIMDDQAWAIRQLVVKIGGWLSGTKVVIDTAIVESISYTQSLIHARATREDIRRALSLSVE
jgi:hypothetical protein